MKVLIVYDTFFGNTEHIARSVGAGLVAHEVNIVKTSDLAPDAFRSVQILIVGSPTRAFSASPDTRKLLSSLSSQSLRGIRVAAFDTRIDAHGFGALIFNPLASMFGYAAEPIAEALVRCGGQLAAPPEGFFVMDSEGPLRQGELERAERWGWKIASID
jgi:flavodoxin I